MGGPTPLASLGTRTYMHAQTQTLKNIKNKYSKEKFQDWVFFCVDLTGLELAL